MAHQNNRTTSELPFHVLTKPIGPSCNLECEYCFYLDKDQLYPERSDFSMSEETLETFVRQYIEAQPGPHVSFAWQGGEPTLLGVDFFRKVVQFQEQYAPPEMTVINALQTNGTLLDEEWGTFLAEEDFLVGISIDGPRDLHDEFRRTRSDDSTFDAVMEGLSILQEYDVEHNVLCVVNDVNVRHPLEVYDFYRRNNIDWIQFIPLVEPPDGAESGDGLSEEESVKTKSQINHQIPNWVQKRGGDVTERDGEYETVVELARSASLPSKTVDPEMFGEFLCTIFDEWIRNDIGSVSVQQFDQGLEVLLQGSPSLCVYDETCGRQVALEHNGDVYACDHYVDPGFKRGNLHETHLTELITDPAQRQFGEYKRDGLPSRCRDCEVQEYCNGGCPKNRHLTAPNGDPGLNYLCPGYRRFFTYIQPYFELIEQTLEDGLPIQYVMDSITTLDERYG